MKPLKIFRLFHFVLDTGPDFTAQIDKLIEFAKDIKERYDNLDAPADGTPVPEVAAMRLCGDEDVNALALSHPDLASCCEAFANLDGEVSTAASASPQMVLRDLIRAILEDPERFLNLFFLFRDLFAPPANEEEEENMSETQDVNETAGQ